MDADQIEALIVQFIQEELLDSEASGIDRDENLLTSGLVDSVGVVRLIAHLSRALGVEVPPPQLIPENFRTIQIMAAYMHGLSTARNGSTEAVPEGA